MRAGKATFTDPGDDQLRALLARYQCPLPFHAVRTCLLGMIASPAMGVSPLAGIQNLWGGELPTFETPVAAETLLEALIALWNALTKYQQRQTPFRLTAIDVAVTDAGLARFATVRRKELDGFIEGLYGQDNEIELPERAQQAIKILGEIRAMLAGIIKIADRSKPSADQSEIKGLLAQLRELSRIAEIEIHAVLQFCTQARQQPLRPKPQSRRM